MNGVDWVVLLGTMIGIAAYGSWRTRHVGSLTTYLKGNPDLYRVSTDGSGMAKLSSRQGLNSGGALSPA